MNRSKLRNWYTKWPSRGNFLAFKKKELLQQLKQKVRQESFP